MAKTTNLFDDTQIWELRCRIGDKGSLLSALETRDGMSYAEYIRRADRYRELAGRLDFSTTGNKMKGKWRHSRRRVLLPASQLRWTPETYECGFATLPKWAF